MSFVDLGPAKALMTMRLETAQRRVDTEKQLRQAGVLQRGWFFEKRCWLLCQLGHQLVALGQRLQRSAVSEPLSFSGHVE